jgi:hypothetical protein
VITLSPQVKFYARGELLASHPGMLDFVEQQTRARWFRPKIAPADSRGIVPSNKIDETHAPTSGARSATLRHSLRSSNLALDTREH